MNIQFQTYSILPPLAPYIHKIWVYRSTAPMPRDDLRLVVPNGRPLMTVPLCNGITGKKNERFYTLKTHQVALVGISDKPSVVDAATAGPICQAGVEFSPLGLYRFFQINLKTTSDLLHRLTDLLPQQARMLEEQLMNAPAVAAKVEILQQFLLSLICKSTRDELFEYCVQKLVLSQGNIRISELERQTGYSSRWLNTKFENLLGMSPKNLASIVRFQRNYQEMIMNPAGFFNRKDFFDHYHDESHFIKNFKRYTGFAPSRIMQLKNDFGKVFYRD